MNRTKGRENFRDLDASLDHAPGRDCPAAARQGPPELEMAPVGRPESRCDEVCSAERLMARAPIGVAVAVLLAVFAGCAVGPNYRRPDVSTPTSFRSPNDVSPLGSSSGTNSLGDLGWWQVFRDPQLQSYIHEALTNSWDIRIAAARVLQAEANAKIVRSQFLPSVSAGGDVVTARSSQRGPAAPPAGVDPQRVYGDV
ncbi:MAG: TolC family protein, partial [Verrucomicrobiales bacterium]|nr:TolC family protein [Verrucomicrobiales bacterium]